MKPKALILIVLYVGLMGLVAYQHEHPEVVRVEKVKKVTERIPVEKQVIQYVDRQTGKEVVKPTQDDATLNGGIHVLKDWSQRTKDDYDYDYGWKVFSVYGRTCFVYDRFQRKENSESIWCEQ